MIHILGTTAITIPVIMIEWEPRNWSDRTAWGPEASDGIYMTKAGDLYRLVGRTVIYITKEDQLQ